MNHQWAQFDHHDTLAWKLTDDEERELVKAWSQSGSFDDVIAEIQGEQHEYQ